MTHHEDATCDECTEELIEIDGEFLCPGCDSISGFTLVPSEDEFRL